MTSISSRDRRALIILGVVAVIALAVFFLVIRGGSGSAEEVAAVSPVSFPVAAAPSPQATPSPSEAPDSTSSFEGFSGRDPFTSPIQPAPASDPVPAAEPTPAPSPTPPAGTQPTSESGSTILLDGHSVTLVDVFSADGVQQVSVDVDGRKYTVAPGETFAGSFQLMSVEGAAINFLYADLPFTLEYPA